MASKRRLRRKGCRGKQHYHTSEAALRAQHPTKRGMHVYRCPFSKGGPKHFHVGH